MAPDPTCSWRGLFVNLDNITNDWGKTFAHDPRYLGAELSLTPREAAHPGRHRGILKDRYVLPVADLPAVTRQDNLLRQWIPADRPHRAAIVVSLGTLPPGWVTPGLLDRVAEIARWEAENLETIDLIVWLMIQADPWETGLDTRIGGEPFTADRVSRCILGMKLTP